LFVLVSILNVSKYAAPIFCLFVTVPLNFIINKYWVFRNSENGEKA
jgi:putative flippase GtrA